jgi:hypothetical protein
MRPIDPHVWAYAEVILYVTWALLCVLMNFAGSMGMYHLLKRGDSERKSPGYAKRNAIWLAVMFCAWIVLPWILPGAGDIDRAAFIGLASGFLFCYCIIGIGLVSEFPLKKEEAAAQPVSDGKQPQPAAE